MTLKLSSSADHTKILRLCGSKTPPRSPHQPGGAKGEDGGGSPQRGGGGGRAVSPRARPARPRSLPHAPPPSCPRSTGGAELRRRLCLSPSFPSGRAAFSRGRGAGAGRRDIAFKE